MSDDNPGGAALTVPLDADGKIGALPEPLQKFFDSRIADAVRRAKAAAPAPPTQTGIDPQEYDAAQRRIAELEEADLVRQKRFEEADAKRRERDERERAKAAEKHAQELAERDERATKAQQRAEKQARRQVDATIRAAAVQHGAREESLDELVELLSRRVGLDEQDDDYAPVVLDAHGDPLSGGISQLVIDYLASKPHHRRGGGGQSTGTTGTTTGQTTTDAKRAAILDRIARNGPTGKDLEELASLRSGGRP